jgi:NAD(P)-dependent dehydrogenase (short-subunit alcohol dehydrogenase family)
MKTILITGTSSGIGREAVRYFAERGWQVAATMRNPIKEQELQHLQNVKLFALDVTDELAAKEAINKVINTFGEIDVLLNNAGYTTFGTFEAASTAQIQQQFDTNVFGIFRTTQAILPHFRSRKAGIIINVSSLGGRMTFPLYSLYHATKWAVEGFTESLSYELADLGIKVKLIEPGSVKTDFNGRSTVKMANKDLADYAPYENKVNKNYDLALAQGHGAAPIEIAKAIYLAATDESSQLRYPCPADSEQVAALLKMRHDLPFEDFQGIIKSMLEKS